MPNEGEPAQEYKCKTSDLADSEDKSPDHQNNKNSSDFVIIPFEPEGKFIDTCDL